jgi:small-conductance mechanosensitive channel
MSIFNKLFLLSLLCIVLYFLLSNHPNYAPLRNALLVIAIILVVLIVLIYVIARFWWLFLALIAVFTVALFLAFQNYQILVVEKEKATQQSIPLLQQWR